MPTEDAIAELRRCAGKQFDPDIIEVFCALVEDGDLPPLHISADVTSPEPVFT